MPDSLNDIDWSKLRHAMGRASDTPHFLKRLESADPVLRRAAAKALAEQLYADGKWFTAAGAAVPFLVALAGRADVADRHRILVLLADVLTGDHVTHVLDGLDMRSPHAKKSFARAPAKAIHRATLAGLDTYVACLKDKDARVRAAAAFLLAFLSEGASSTLDAVRATALAEVEPWAKASEVLAWGLLAKYVDASSEAASISALRSANAPAIVRGAAILGRIYVDDQPPGEDTLADLTATILQGDEPELFPWNHGKVEQLIAWQVGERGPAARSLAARAFGGAVRIRGPLAGRWTGRALALAFELRAEPLLANELSEDQRAVLAGLSVRDVPATFAEWGLPSRAVDRRRMLGIEPAGVMEHLVRDRPPTGRGPWPLWRWLCALRDRGDDDKAIDAWLSKRLDAALRLDTWGELLDSAYNVEPPDLSWVVARLAAAPAAASAWGRRVADRLLAEGALGAAVGRIAVWAVARGLRGGEWLPAGYERFVAIAAPMELARESLAHLPIERREAVLLADMERERGLSGMANMTVERVLAVLDLVPTKAVTSRLLELSTPEILAFCIGPERGRELHDRVRAKLAEIRDAAAR